MDKKQLDRILRVRTLQLGLAQAEEARANAQHSSEQALRDRIAALADNVSPVPDARADGLSLIAAAHFRQRLHQSAVAADNRVRQAEAGMVRASAATREARRDQTAIEKLLSRAEKDAVLAEMRKLEDAPPTRKIRHDPC